MLSVIKDFLQNIGDLLLTAWDLVIGLFEDIAYLTKLLKVFVVKIPSYFDWLPIEFVTLLGVGLGVIIVLRVIGRSE